MNEPNRYLLNKLRILRDLRKLFMELLACGEESILLIDYLRQIPCEEPFKEDDYKYLGYYSHTEEAHREYLERLISKIGQCYDDPSGEVWIASLHETLCLHELPQSKVSSTISQDAPE